MLVAGEAPAKAVEASKPGFTEHLVASTNEVLDHILSLDPMVALLNAAMSLGVVAAAYGSLWALRRLSDRWLDRVHVDGDHHEAARTQQAVRLTWSLLRLAAIALVLFVVLGIWGVDARSWFAGQAGERLVRLALVILIATALVELSGFVIKRLVGGFARRSGDARRAAQLNTLGPILTGCAQTLLVVIGALTILTELGLNLGPILASAGVLGIAVGFGAQTLVKDFLTGLFLIAEDVVSVGDNVEIGGASGVVEAMTLRTIRLRDVNATLHIFPYSEAQVIHNRTKVFSAYLADIPISYDTDLDRALAVVRRVGDELCADPKFKPLVTRPFEVMGVDRLADNAVYIKARFITEPRSQWDVGREFNLRIKKAFDAEGVLTPVKTTPVQAQPLEGQRPVGPFPTPAPGAES